MAISINFVGFGENLTVLRFPVASNASTPPPPDVGLNIHLLVAPDMEDLPGKCSFFDFGGWDRVSAANGEADLVG